LAKRPSDSQNGLRFMEFVKVCFIQGFVKQGCTFKADEANYKLTVINNPLSKFLHQLMHKFFLNGVLTFTLKQLQHVSVYSPSSGSALFELAKVTFVETVH
jgi:hypothetical protein